MEGLVQSYGDSTTVGLMLMSFHKLGSAVSADFSIMISTFFAHIFPSSFSLIKFLELILVLGCGSLHLVPSVVL